MNSMNLIVPYRHEGMRVTFSNQLLRASSVSIGHHQTILPWGEPEDSLYVLGCGGYGFKHLFPVRIRRCSGFEISLQVGLLA